MRGCKLFSNINITTQHKDLHYGKLEKDPKAFNEIQERDMVALCTFHVFCCFSFINIQK